MPVIKPCAEISPKIYVYTTPNVTSNESATLKEMFKIVLTNKLKLLALKCK